MPRGFGWYAYTDDTGQVYAVRVDNDYALEPGRGWSPIDPRTVPQLPKAWKPRAVFGVDEGGSTQLAKIASVDADLWTGTAPTFVINGTDQQPHTCTVIGRYDEVTVP